MGLEDRIVREFGVTRAHGNDLGVVMGDLLFKDVNTCLLELVANSHDADASRVDISYEPETDLLVLSDDGSGMDETEIGNFYRLGDSVKLVEPVSQKGRRKIGKFGVATLVLRRLGRHYKLETSQGDARLITEENFTRDDKDYKSINVKKLGNSDNKHGTVITLDELQFTPADSRFDLKTFKRRLAVEMPLSPEFTVYVNGQQVAPHEFRTSTEYVVEASDRAIGEVSGSVFYSRKILAEDEAGIFVKVHGRAVGGQNLTMFGKGFPASLARRIHGVIHADGLSELVGFDRGGFIEHPKVERLMKHVRGVLLQIQNDMKVDVTSQKRDAAIEEFNDLLPKMGRDIGTLLDDQPYELIFDRERAGKISRIDRKEKTLCINPDSPVVKVMKQNKSGIRRALFGALQHALAIENMNAGRLVTYETTTTRIARELCYTKGSVGLADLLVESEDELPLGKRTSPSRLYAYKEVSRLTGLGNAVVKRAVTAGVLNDRGEERIKGEAVIDLSEKLKGKVTLYDGVREAIPDYKTFGYSADYSLWQIREEEGIRRLKALDKLPEWVEDLSPSSDETFYVINRKDFEKFKLFIREWKLEGTNGDDEDVPEPVSDETIDEIVQSYQAIFNLRATKQYITNGIISGNNVVPNPQTRRAFPAALPITLNELSQHYEIEVDAIRELAEKAGFDGANTLTPFESVVVCNRLLEDPYRGKPTDYVEFDGIYDSLLIDPAQDIAFLDNMKEKGLFKSGTETDYGNIKYQDYRRIYEGLERGWASAMSDANKQRKEIMSRLGYLEMPAIISELQKRGIKVDTARTEIGKLRSSIVLGTIHTDRVNDLARQILNSTI